MSDQKPTWADLLRDANYQEIERRLQEQYKVVESDEREGGCDIPGCESGRIYSLALGGYVDCECRIREKSELWTAETLEIAGLSSRERKHSLTNYDPTRPGAASAFDYVERYVEDWDTRRTHGEGLYLHGEVGTGKSHLAAAVLAELMDRKRVVGRFVTVPDLLDDIRGAYNDPTREAEEIVSTVKDAELLVLDDLGSEKATAWALERLFVIVNHRYREELPTIVTSNSDMNDLAASLGERLTSRLQKMCRIVKVEGPDRRVNPDKEKT